MQTSSEPKSQPVRDSSKKKTVSPSSRVSTRRQTASLQKASAQTSESVTEKNKSNGGAKTNNESPFTTARGKSTQFNAQVITPPFKQPSVSNMDSISLKLKEKGSVGV